MLIPMDEWYSGARFKLKKKPRKKEGRAKTNKKTTCHQMPQFPSFDDDRKQFIISRQNTKVKLIPFRVWSALTKLDF
jgi:hypothetical protein